MYETDNRDTFAESLAYGCYQYGNDKDGYMQNTLQSQVANGDYSGLDISYWEQWPQLVENATNAVDTVLGGTRTTNATQWHGENELNWTYNRFTDSSNVPGLSRVG